MRILLSIILFTLFFYQICTGQKHYKAVYTSDIDNFWMAYDSVKATHDSIKQVDFVQRLYVNKGSQGLKEFMFLRNNNAANWVKLILKYPKFWESIRPNTLKVKEQAGAINQAVVRFKEIYPEMTPVKMYFMIGGLNSGGTTTGTHVLVGSEIATADKKTDASELGHWLQNVFEYQDQANLVGLNIHECVHTQQIGEGSNLLCQALKEGSCDFIEELVLDQPLKLSYISYGKIHDSQIRDDFKKQMFSNEYGNWLYNGGKSSTQADLGYYVGYTICKKFYNRANDKIEAVKEIVELNYGNEAAVERFLKESGYFKEHINKAEIIRAYEKELPVVVNIFPDINHSISVDTSIKEIKIAFSKPMIEGYSINKSGTGKAYPIAGISGLPEDKKSYIIKLKLEPKTNYEFILTGLGFKSVDGYPLKEQVISFTTK